MQTNMWADWTLRPGGGVEKRLEDQNSLLMKRRRFGMKQGEKLGGCGMFGIHFEDKDFLCFY